MTRSIAIAKRKKSIVRDIQDIIGDWKEQKSWGVSVTSLAQIIANKIVIIAANIIYSMVKLINW